MLYFAYGSNLDRQQMRERCPGSVDVCTAKLKGYRLDFTRNSTKWGGGVADVVEVPNEEVWGVVYEVTGDDVNRLDCSEGYRPGRTKNSYTRGEITVDRDGDPQQPIQVAVYFAVLEPGEHPPSKHYLGAIIGGARQWGLPGIYIARLEAITTVD